MISVIVPVYNAAQYLEACFDRILAQTDTDFELLLIDDGSTDASGGICDAYAQRFPGIRVFHQPNKGVSSARNLGIDEAKGEFLTFIDADDCIDKGYLQALLQACQKNQVKISCCPVYAVDECGVILNKKEMEPGVYTSVDALNSLFQFCKVSTGPCAKLFHKDLLSHHRFPMRKTYEDLLFVYQVFNESDRVAFTKDTVYRYVHRPNTGAMSRFMESPTDDVLCMAEELLVFTKGKNAMFKETFYSIFSQPFLYLPQAIQSINQEQSKVFLKKARKLIRKNIHHVLTEKQMPVKEKIRYCILAYNFFIFRRIWGKDK